LLRPDTYIGSVEFDTQTLWVYNKENDEIEYKPVTFVPGLYKIFGKLSISSLPILAQFKSDSLLN